MSRPSWHESEYSLRAEALKGVRLLLSWGILFPVGVRVSLIVNHGLLSEVFSADLFFAAAPLTFAPISTSFSRSLVSTR